MSEFSFNRLFAPDHRTEVPAATPPHDNERVARGVIPTATRPSQNEGSEKRDTKSEGQTISVCPIYWDDDIEGYVYGDERDVVLETAPRPLVLESGHSLVLCRFEVRVKEKSWSQKKIDRNLVLALWPYTQGWIDFVPFRGAHPTAKGKRVTSPVDAFNIGQSAGANPLEEALSKLDSVPYDPYLMDASYSVAGKFLFNSFFPTGEKPRFYREPLKEGGEQSWVLGLVDQPKKVEGHLASGKNLERVVRAASDPFRKGGITGGWTREEQGRLADSAHEVALIAIRASLAGYRTTEHRARGEQAGTPGRVLDYACRVAREIGEKYMDPKPMGRSDLLH